MADTQTQQQTVNVETPEQRLERLWQAGRTVYWNPGDPVPESAQVTPHEGGLMTLERIAPEGFDMDIREKVLRQVDEAFARAFKEDSEEHPGGQRPYSLLVNPGFTHYFPTVESWGDLNPPCRVREVDGKDKRFNLKTAVKVGPEGRQVKAVFLTSKPAEEANADSRW